MHDFNESDIVCVKALTDLVCHPGSHNQEAEKGANTCTQKYGFDAVKDKSLFSCKEDHYGYIGNGKFIKADPYVETSHDSSMNAKKTTDSKTPEKK